MICSFVWSIWSVELLVERGLERTESWNVHIHEEGRECWSYWIAHHPRRKYLRNRFESWRCLGYVLLLFFLLTNKSVQINSLLFLFFFKFRNYRLMLILDFYLFFNNFFLFLLIHFRLFISRFIWFDKCLEKNKFIGNIREKFLLLED